MDPNNIGKETTKLLNMIFCKRSNFKTILKLYQTWEPVTWPQLKGWYTSKFMIFDDISGIQWYFFMKSFLFFIYQALAADIRNLILSRLVVLEQRLKELIVAASTDFWRLWKCFFLVLKKITTSIIFSHYHDDNLQSYYENLYHI